LTSPADWAALPSPFHVLSMSKLRRMQAIERPDSNRLKTNGSTTIFTFEECGRPESKRTKLYPAIRKPATLCALVASPSVDGDWLLPDVETVETLPSPPDLVSGGGGEEACDWGRPRRRPRRGLRPAAASWATRLQSTAATWAMRLLSGGGGGGERGMETSETVGFKRIRG
jgi:hypothetical protein